MWRWLSFARTIIYYPIFVFFAHYRSQADSTFRRGLCRNQDSLTVHGEWEKRKQRLNFIRFDTWNYCIILPLLSFVFQLALVSRYYQTFCFSLLAGLYSIYTFYSNFTFQFYAGRVCLFRIPSQETSWFWVWTWRCFTAL